MKYKKIMLIALLLLAVLTIGAVSASDVASDDSIAASDDAAVDNVTASDDVDIIADGDDDEDEEEGELYIEEDSILVDYDTEIVGLDTGEERDTGRLVVFDTDTNEVYYNNTLANMTYYTEWMKYKYNTYDGYYIFPADLNVKSGVYNINATYYDDDYTIIETVVGKVNIDMDSFITDGETDINDDTTILVSAYIFDWFEDGYLVIGYGGYEDAVIVKKIALTPADLGTVMNFTRSDLDLEIGDYDGLFAAYLPDWGDIEEDLETIVEEDVKIVDDTKFRASFAEEFASILYKNESFFVYFPAGSAGTNITIYVNDKPVITKSITEEDAGDYYGFTLRQLNITEVEKEYSFAIYNNDTGDVLFENYTYEFENPIEFSDLCAIGSSADVLVELFVPKGFNEGLISVVDNDGTVFEKYLAEMEPDSEGREIYFERYEIPLENLTKSYAPGIYEFGAFYRNDDLMIIAESYVRIVERKHVENENVSIEIFDYLIFDVNNFDDEDPDAIVEVIADNEDGFVIIWIGDDWSITLEDPEDDDGEGWVYTLTVEDIEGFEEGSYPINVTYYDGEGTEVLNLSSNIDVVNGRASAEIVAHDVLMKDDWNYTDFVVVRALYDFKGSVVIFLDNESFEISLNDLIPIPDTDNPLFGYYYIDFNDLNKSDYEAREYDVFIEIYDEDDDEDPIWDNGDGDEIYFFEPQIAQDDNVTIEIIPTPTIIPDDPFIFITAKDNSTNVTIRVENADPISIALTDCFYDETNDWYVISAVDLDIGVGEYELNVTYQNLSLKGKVNLISNLVINMPEDGETIYWGCDQDPVIAWFQLREGDIKTDIVYGNVTVSVYLDGENETVCFKKDISELEWHGGLAALVIRLSDLEGCSNLTGYYEVDVSYEGGTEAANDADYTYFFKELAADDFSVDIVGDRIIFSVPDNVFGEVNVTIDGESTVKDIWDLEWDDDEGVKYLEFDGLGTGTHKVSVSFIGFSGSSMVLADTIANPIDPALTIAIADIEEGNPAVVTVTTNATFSGNVTVTIGTVNFNVTVENGKGTLSIPDLPAGSYIATAAFNAQYPFGESVKTTTFKVGVNPNLTIAIANIQEGNPAVVTVTTNATFSGNVTVTIANKNYTVSVVNGKGTINVAGLAAGPYTATAIFAATDIFAYSEKTTSFTVTKKPVTPVKKADKIKLTLKKVKVKKSAKKLVLRATLKINGKAVKGKKITFKF